MCSFFFFSISKTCVYIIISICCMWTNTYVVCEIKKEKKNIKKTNTSNILCLYVGWFFIMYNQHKNKLYHCYSVCLHTKLMLFIIVHNHTRTSCSSLCTCTNICLHTRIHTRMQASTMLSHRKNNRLAGWLDGWMAVIVWNEDKKKNKFCSTLS